MEKDLQIKYSKALQEVQRERNALRAENEQLKQQLAEKEQRVAELECKLNEKQKAESGRGWRLENGKVIYYCNLLSDYKMERSLEDVVKDLNQMTKESDNAWEMRTLYQGLKNELAEKEKMLERIMSGEYIPANIAEKSLELSTQDKISFCVEQLEKVKKVLVEKMKLAHDKLDCAYEIDNQIKQLKEGK